MKIFVNVESVAGLRLHADLTTPMSRSETYSPSLLLTPIWLVAVLVLCMLVVIICTAIRAIAHFRLSSPRARQPRTVFATSPIDRPAMSCASSTVGADDRAPLRGCNSGRPTFQTVAVPGRLWRSVKLRTSSPRWGQATTDELMDTYEGKSLPRLHTSTVSGAIYTPQCFGWLKNFKFESERTKMQSTNLRTINKIVLMSIMFIFAVSEVSFCPSHQVWKVQFFSVTEIKNLTKIVCSLIRTMQSRVHGLELCANIIRPPAECANRWERTWRGADTKLTAGLFSSALVELTRAYVQPECYFAFERSLKTVSNSPIKTILRPCFRGQAIQWDQRDSCTTKPEVLEFHLTRAYTCMHV